VASAFQEEPPEWLAAEERFYKRLGLVPADADLNALIVQLYSSAVAAYYRPETGTFYVIQRDAPFASLDKIYVSHEYTHALQDMHFDLETNRVSDLTQTDAALAQLSVIEGDATLTSQQWMIDNLSDQEQLELVLQAFGELSQDQFAGVPLILRRQLEFPYAEGLLFTRDIYGLGGYDAVNAAIQTPPASTEQILHSQKYYDAEAPVAVELVDLAPLLGEGWSNVYQQTMGELGLQVVATGGQQPPVNIPGLPAEWPHQEVAAGWGGDRLAMFENAATGAWAIEWETAWDTTADADEFSTRLSELAATFQGVMRSAPGTEANSVRMFLTSDQPTMDLVSGPR
jgi:hypothetical protein